MITKNKPTLRDVAKYAGVSHQTVSRVINDKERVSPETRARVADAIAKLGFSPNAIARSMAQGRAHTLACLSPNLTDYTFASIIEGAEVEARQLGYFLLSSSVKDGRQFKAFADELIASRRVDGVLVINPFADDRHLYLPQDFPLAFVGTHVRAEKISSVGLDDEGAARVATQHLLDCGHRRIALVSGPQAEDCVQDRRAGYEEALRAVGLEPNPAWVCEGDWSASSGYQAAVQLLRGADRPTAVFAQNDRMAIGLLRAARDAGLKVPEQLAVIGFDDMPLSAYFDPPLTTMRQDLEAIGRQAVGLLIHAVQDPEAPPQHLRFPSHLVVRQSTRLP
jgi:LacI family transcriptional regulator, repressor for deo operon, udp, cdd, tsx, nupC, and nupG